MPDRELSAARYAIYFVPAPDSTLYRFGTEFLGYNCYTGAETPKPAWYGLTDAAWRALTGAPRKYGFHATLKAPFCLASSSSIEELVRSLGEFAREMRRVPMQGLSVSSLGSFIALTDPSTEINRLADECVRSFDRFRAPMSEKERARRLQSGLTARQTEHVDRWGYPYVFDDFRFHMTLTGPVGRGKESLLSQLRDAFARRVDPAECVLNRIALVRQETPSNGFRVIHSAELSRSD
jgi:putative phosphonate metabolism protein